MLVTAVVTVPVVVLLTMPVVVELTKVPTRPWDVTKLTTVPAGTGLPSRSVA